MSSRTPSRYVQSQLETLLLNGGATGDALRTFLINAHHARIAHSIAWGGSPIAYVSAFVGTCSQRGIIDEEFLGLLEVDFSFLAKSPLFNNLRIHLGIDPPENPLFNPDTIKKLKQLAWKGEVHKGVLFARLGRVTLPRELRNRAAQNSFSAKDQVAAWIEAANLQDNLDELDDGDPTWMETIFQCALDEGRSKNPGALRQGLTIAKTRQGAQPAGDPEPEEPPKPWFEDLPLDLSRKETKTAINLLRKVYGTGRRIRALAANAGVPANVLSEGGSAAALVEELVVLARRRNRLIALFKVVRNDPGVEAIHSDLDGLFGPGLLNS